MKKTLKTISILYLAFLFIAGWSISFPCGDIFLQLTPIPPLLIFIYRMYKKWQQNKVIEEPKYEDSICSYVIGFILKVINIICIGYMVVIGHEWTLGVSEPLAYFMPAFPIAFFLSRQFEGKGAKKILLHIKTYRHCISMPVSFSGDDLTSASAADFFCNHNLFFNFRFEFGNV